MPSFLITLHRDSGAGFHTCVEDGETAFDAIVKRVENNGLVAKEEYGGVTVSAIEAPQEEVDDSETNLHLDACLAQTYYTGEGELKVIELNGEDEIPDTDASLETLAERYPFGCSVDFGGQHPRMVLGIVMRADKPALSINASNDEDKFQYGIVRFDKHLHVRRV